jgi:hypothetical protein
VLAHSNDGEVEKNKKTTKAPTTTTGNTSMCLVTLLHGKSQYDMMWYNFNDFSLFTTSLIWKIMMKLLAVTQINVD